MGMLISFAMMAGLNLLTWYRLVGWLLIGMVIYFTYSRNHSKVQAMQGQAAPVAGD
jgi:APA family basic amino acid/polyamine antiporter